LSDKDILVLNSVYRYSVKQVFH